MAQLYYVTKKQFKNSKKKNRFLTAHDTEGRDHFLVLVDLEHPPFGGKLGHTPVVSKRRPSQNFLHSTVTNCNTLGRGAELSWAAFASLQPRWHRAAPAGCSRGRRRRQKLCLAGSSMAWRRPFATRQEGGDRSAAGYAVFKRGSIPNRKK